MVQRHVSFLVCSQSQGWRVPLPMAADTRPGLCGTALTVCSCHASNCFRCFLSSASAPASSRKRRQMQATQHHTQTGPQHLEAAGHFVRCKLCKNAHRRSLCILPILPAMIIQHLHVCDRFAIQLPCCEVVKTALIVCATFAHRPLIRLADHSSTTPSTLKARNKCFLSFPLNPTT